MDRAEFNLTMQGEMRVLLQKHERERKAVRERDAFANPTDQAHEAIRRENEERQRAVLNAAEQLDSAIYLFSDRIYDLVKGEGAP